ncbi:hypothetical protein, partial [Halodesulfurarchaeum sp.]|uniref:hypothetical protein n=1 Tax=Halodesulfurarchaeum sp. TaxID=1980530 RepID=UPI002FC31088
SRAIGWGRLSGAIRGRAVQRTDRWENERTDVRTDESVRATQPSPAIGTGSAETVMVIAPHEHS